MNLEEARSKRLEADAASQGWDLVTTLEGGPFEPSRVWIYSINAETGLRYATHLSSAYYRDILAGGGRFKAFEESAFTPLELVTRAVETFDAGQLHRHALLKVLAYFAGSTGTWAKLEPLSAVGGIHFVITDWETDDGRSIISSIATYADKPLSFVQLAQTMTEQVKVHLALAPDLAPKILKTLATPRKN
jgi:hypothetical protein